MSLRDTNSRKLAVGMYVEVNPQSDRSRKKIVQGTIAEILTNADHHPHGLLVRLESGETGRVKRIIDDKSFTPPHQETIVFSEFTQLKVLIEKGENHNLEFKSDALWSINFSAEDINNHIPQTKELRAYGKATSKIIIAKTLAGFLNSDGGTLIIGVKEDKEGGADQIIGIERELGSLKDSCLDGYRRMVVDLIKSYFPVNIFNHLNNYLKIDFEEIDGMTVCGIRTSKSDKRVFLKFNNTDHFFIRTDASTRELTGEEVVDYCQTRFS